MSNYFYRWRTLREYSRHRTGQMVTIHRCEVSLKSFLVCLDIEEREHDRKAEAYIRVDSDTYLEFESCCYNKSISLEEAKTKFTELIRSRFLQAANALKSD